MSTELNANITLGEVQRYCIGRRCLNCRYEDLHHTGQCRFSGTLPQHWELAYEDELSPAPQSDPVSPAHYQQGARQTLDEMLIIFGIEAVKAFCLCNVYKYKTRAGLKNGHEDLAKADRYLTFYEHLCEHGHIKWDELEE